MKKNGNSSLCHEIEIEEYEAVFPRGRSMHPFIKGGQIVWCKRYTASETNEVRRGDIIWYLINDNSHLIHRVTAKLRNNDGSQVRLITRGDPMVIGETVEPKDVLGKALYTEASNTCIYSLTTGFTGWACSLYGRLSELLHTVDRFGKNSTVFSDRRNMFFRGVVFKLFRPILIAVFSTALGMYLFFAGLPLKRQRADRNKQTFEIIRATLNQEVLKRTLNAHDSKALLEHELAGAHVDELQRAYPALRDLNAQKKRQLFVALKIHFFWQQLLLQCDEHKIPVLPLKGLSLSLSVYDDDPSVRRLGDIDLLIPTEKLRDFAELLDTFNYVPKNPRSLQPGYQLIKHKAEFYCKDPSYPDLDVHTEIVVKKILTRHTQLRAAEIFQRAVNKTSQLGSFKALHPIDEWLYLAYHLALHHRFSGTKWFLDLKLIIDGFEEQDWKKLLDRASCSGLNKTTLATLEALEIFYTLPAFCSERPRISFDFFGRIALADAISRRNILLLKNKQGGSGFVAKLDAGIWELHFIDKTADQFRALPRLFFPSHGFFNTVFGNTPFPLYCFLLPFLPPAMVVLFSLYAANTLVKAALQRFRNV